MDNGEKKHVSRHVRERYQLKNYSETIDPGPNLALFT